MINMQLVRKRIAAMLVKQTIAEFCDDQVMLEEVEIEKAKIIKEVATNDTAIRTRFNDLLQQH